MNKFTLPGRAREIKGTITAPENAGLRLVLSTCAESGEFKSPLQALLTRRWAKVREDYKGWFATRQNFKLGNLNTTAVASDVWVIHALCQNDKGQLDDKALESCVKKLGELAKYEKASVHVSKWLVDESPKLKELLLATLVADGVNVYFYEEPTK